MFYSVLLFYFYFTHSTINLNNFNLHIISHSIFGRTITKRFQNHQKKKSRELVITNFSLSCCSFFQLFYCTNFINLFFFQSYKMTFLFLKRVFTKANFEYIHIKSHKSQHFAAVFSLSKKNQHKNTKERKASIALLWCSRSKDELCMQSL